MSSPSTPNSPIWIYHERQEALLCGQHALNNLVQGCVFTPSSLAEIAHQLDAMERQMLNSAQDPSIPFSPSCNVDEQGNFSIQVLNAALQNQYGLSLVAWQPNQSHQPDVTTLQGFICHRNDHWFAIRNIHGRYWNLNSLFERPQLISHFQLALQMQQLIHDGYSVFCVPTGLPTLTTQPQPERDTTGTNHFWWTQHDLLNTTTTNNQNPQVLWNQLGQGMRCDGKHNNNHLENMTEQQLLQFALQQSLQHTPTTNDLVHIPLTPEPPANTPGTVNIQFRMPQGTVVRRFRSDESVQVLYAFGQHYHQQRPVELKAGFPPKSLKHMCQQTIQQANLGGECIHCRILE